MGLLDSVTGTLFGEKQKPSTQMSGVQELINLFPQYKQAGTDFLTRGLDLSNQTLPFIPNDIAPLSILERQGIGALGAYKAPQTGFNFGKKADAAYGMASDLISGVDPLIDTAQDYFAQGASPITSGDISSSISDFMNPYIGDVVDNTIRDISEYGNGLFSDARSLISDAGATGSNRGDLLAADIAGDLTRTVGDYSSNLRMQGFNSAASNALSRLQGDRGRAIDAGVGTVGSANALTSAGGTAAGLGANLWDSRMGVDALANNDLQRALDLSKGRMATGGVQRDVVQSVLDREGDTRQIPLKQLELLKFLLNGFPNSGSQYGGTAATDGLIGSGGTIGKNATSGVLDYFGVPGMF